jgi:pimeloyl-ACP methyl ester carboxylesterase
MMISPIGIRVPPEGETWQMRMEARRKEGQGPPKFIMPIMNFIWKR